MRTGASSSTNHFTDLEDHTAHDKGAGFQSLVSVSLQVSELNTQCNKIGSVDF